MKIEAMVMNNKDWDYVEVKQDLGLRIEHNGNLYALRQDNNGNLIFTSLSKVQLIVKPRSANSVEFDLE